MEAVLNFNAYPKQIEFFKAKERYVAYGGARAGGKSWAARKKAELLAMRYSGIQILLLRRSMPELRENHLLPKFVHPSLCRVSLYLENTCFARSIGVIPWEKLNFFIISRIIKKCGLLKHPIPEVAIRITYCLLCDGLIIFCSRYIVSPAIKKP